MITTYIAYDVLQQGGRLLAGAHRRARSGADALRRARPVVSDPTGPGKIRRSMRSSSPSGSSSSWRGWLGAIWGSTDRGPTRLRSPSAGQKLGGHPDRRSRRSTSFVVVSVLVLMVLMLVLFRGTEPRASDASGRVRPRSGPPARGAGSGRSSPWVGVRHGGRGHGGACSVVPTSSTHPQLHGRDPHLRVHRGGRRWSATAPSVPSSVAWSPACRWPMSVGTSVGSLEPMAALALVVVSLMIRPEGIFARPAARRV